MILSFVGISILACFVGIRMCVNIEFCRYVDINFSEVRKYVDNEFCRYVDIDFFGIRRYVDIEFYRYVVFF